MGLCIDHRGYSQGRATEEDGIQCSHEIKTKGSSEVCNQLPRQQILVNTHDACPGDL